MSINTGKPSYWTNLRVQVGSHMMTTLHMSHLTFIVLGGLIPRGEQGFSGRKFRLPELHISHKLYHDIGLPWTSCFIRSTRVGNVSHLCFLQGWRRRCVKWAPWCSRRTVLHYYGHSYCCLNVNKNPFSSALAPHRSRSAGGRDPSS